MARSNNLVYNCKGNALNIAEIDKSSPLDQFTFKPNFFEGNIIYGNKKSNTTIPEGVKFFQPKISLSKDGLFRLDNDSPLINTGVNSEIKTDMDGQIRDSKIDIGADEFTSSKSTIHPLTASEVGPNWIISKEKSGEKF